MQKVLNRRTFLKQVAFTTSTAFLLAQKIPLEAVSKRKKPNVLFVVSDDLRPDLGCYGDETIHSPNIDKLAARGTVFNRAYCQVAVCNPSRNSFLSGLRPDTISAYDNYHLPLREQMPDVVTLPQLFKNNGHTSLSIGKVYHHSASEPNNDPLSWSEPMYGFGQPYRHWYNEDSLELIEELRRQGKRPRGPAYEASEQPDNAYPDGVTADMAIDTLRRVKDEPFFLAVGFIKPHLPFTCPQKYWDMYPPESIRMPDNYHPPKDVPAAAMHDWYELRSYGDMPKEGDVTVDQALNLIRGYRACISFLDAQVGRVLDELDNLGLRDNTIVVLIGDHGYHLGENRIWTKMTNFELSLRSPMIISAPGQSGPGKTSDALVEFVDIYPTLAELADLKAPETLEGLSMKPLLDNPDLPWKQAAFSVYGRAGRPSRYRPEEGDPLGRSMRTDRYRYTEWKTKNDQLVGRELYDMKTDSENNINVANRPENKELVENLSQQLRDGWEAALP